MINKKIKIIMLVLPIILILLANLMIFNVAWAEPVVSDNIKVADAASEMMDASRNIPSDTGSKTYFGENLPEYVKNFYNWLVGIGGALATIMIIWAGYEYATSAGDVEKVNQAKEKIVGAVIGLILLITAGLVMNALKTGSSTSSGTSSGVEEFIDVPPTSPGSTPTPTPTGSIAPEPITLPEPPSA